jgi:hypothetical protein
MDLLLLVKPELIPAIAEKLPGVSKWLSANGVLRKLYPWIILSFCKCIATALAQKRRCATWKLGRSSFIRRLPKAFKYGKFRADTHTGSLDDCLRLRLRRPTFSTNAGEGLRRRASGLEGEGSFYATSNGGNLLLTPIAR